MCPSPELQRSAGEAHVLGLWSHLRHLPAAPFLRPCVTITVPLDVTASCEKLIKPSCLCLVDLVCVSFCTEDRVGAASQGQASDPPL